METVGDSGRVELKRLWATIFLMKQLKQNDKFGAQNFIKKIKVGLDNSLVNTELE